MSIDWESGIGARTAARLHLESVAWLTTVNADYTPVPSPVWFWWDAGDILVYSKDRTIRLANLASRPIVSLSVQVDAIGEQVSVVTGPARIDPLHPSAAEFEPYRAKYAHLMQHVLDQTPEQFAIDFPVPILITPTVCRGF
jgi:PPOX class probable F420-dependent enzyme